MTTRRRDSQDSPFGDWIRHHPGLHSIRERLSVTDSDYWIHRYRAHSDKVGERAVDSIMLVELKTHSRDIPMAQRDTLILVNQLLHKAVTRKDGRRRHLMLKGIQPGEIRKVRCYGVKLLQLSGERPDTSEFIYWNRASITQDMLVEILRFDRDPDRPMKTAELRRHHTSKKATNLMLFPEHDALRGTR